MNKNNRNRTLAVIVVAMMTALIVVPSVGGATTEEELDLVTKSFIDSNEGLRLVFKEPLPLPPSIRVWIPEERELRSKVFVLECGSGLNPKSYGNMIEYLLEKGIVVGIFPRENSYDRNTQDQEILRDLDLNDRANNLEEVCEILKFIPDIEVVGHSEGGASVFLFASRVGDSIPGLKVTIIDMNLFCEPGTEEWRNAQICYNTSKEMLKQGVCVAGDLTAQRELAYAAKFYSDTDSGFPRPEPLPGNFTYEGLFYFSLIYTGSLPGVLTPLTGLPDGWVL